MDGYFMEEVTRRSGEVFLGCFHCLSCAGGCPVVEEMDFNPNQLIRMVQFGMREQVLGSRSIWLCVGCFSCLSQCPNRVDIPAMMDTLREMAIEGGVVVGEPSILAFHRAFLDQLRRRGRVYELAFMLRYKLATGAFFQDMVAGVRMMLRGRLRWTPTRCGDSAEVARLMGVR